MKKKYSVDFYLIMLAVISIVLNFLGLINLSWTELFSYIAMFWGISMFYYSYLKNYKFGIFSGAVLFQIGIVLLSLNLFEIYEPAVIFIPTVLVIVGSSLLLSNLLVTSNKLALVLSIIFILVGVLLMIFRGHYTFGLFFNSVYQLLKEFWLIIIILFIIILLVANEFRNENRNRN